MGKQFTTYTKKQFYFFLIQTMKELKMYGKCLEVTEQFPDTWEAVYSIPTRNKSVDIVVYSSVDLRTQRTRDKGADMVRIVLRWKTKDGFMYKRIAHRERLVTLFANVKKSIADANEKAFGLKWNEFQPMTDYKPQETPQAPQEEQEEQQPETPLTPFEKHLEDMAYTWEAQRAYEQGHIY